MPRADPSQAQAAQRPPPPPAGLQEGSWGAVQWRGVGTPPSIRDTNSFSHQFVLLTSILIYIFLMVKHIPIVDSPDVK